MIGTTEHGSVLILGAGGRLGRMLRAVWVAHPPAGITLHFQSRKPLSERNSHLWYPGLPADLLPPCDTVIALWGQTAGDAEALALNRALAGESRKVALACRASRVFHVSSAAVYGPAEMAAETTPAAPVTAYGRSKLAMEQRIAQFNDPDLRHCVLRLANVVGADSLAPALLAGGPVKLDRFADGTGPLRSYIGAEDLADLFLRLARLPAGALPRLLNAAAHNPLSMQALAEAGGKRIIWQTAPPGALQRVTLDTDRLAQLLPRFHPTTDPARLIAGWRAHKPQA